LGLAAGHAAAEFADCLGVDARDARRPGEGKRWRKRAIWGNTLPAMKRGWKSADRLTSGEFVGMWRRRIDTLYARYPTSTIQQPEA
jgi:hypothetical protein